MVEDTASLGPAGSPDISKALDWAIQQSCQQGMLGHDRRIGSHVGEFEIVGVLGRGATGIVYNARQAAPNRVVALKMIMAGGHAAPGDLARLRTEADFIARLQHPNIVQIFAVGEQDGLPFLALEYCRGGSLADKLKGGTPLPHRDAATLVVTLALALQAAHDKGIIHRDLKPANVLFADNGEPKVSDFGLAKDLDEPGQTRSGALMGTPAYMSPEQASGEANRVGPAADVYGLGAILYACLTGRSPFQAATPPEMIRQVREDDPKPPSRLTPTTPRDLDTICLKCLRKELHNRYSSAEELAQDLKRFLADESILARPDGWRDRITRALTRDRMGQAFNHWDTLMFLLAAITLSHLAFFILEHTGQPAYLSWWLGLITWAATWVILGWYFYVAARSLTEAERQERQMLLVIAGNVIAAGCIDWILQGSPPGRLIWRPPPPQLYPSWAVIHALCFFFIATTHSGLFYWYSLVFFVLAIAMSYLGDLARVAYVLTWTVVWILLARHFRMRRHGSEDRRVVRNPG